MDGVAVVLAAVRGGGSHHVTRPADRASVFAWLDVAAGLDGVAVTAAWPAGMTNAFNRIDGSDGLAAGVYTP